MACTCSSSDTSTPTAMADPPADSISRTVSLALSTLMSAATTRAPSCAKRTADTRPTPEPAPVTMAVLPSSTPLSAITHSPGGRFGRREPVQPLGVAAEQLVLDLCREVLHRVAGDLDAVGPRRVRVRIVGLAHDVVLAELVQALDCVAVLDDATVDVVAERLPDVERVEVGLVACVAHELRAALHPVALLVQHLLGALQEVGHPAAFALGQGDLQVRVALEQPAEEPGQHGARGARRAPGEVGHERCVIADPGQRRRRADVHAGHHFELVGRSHDGLPVVVGVVNRGQPQRFRVLGEGEGRDALGGHALHLLGGQLPGPTSESASAGCSGQGRHRTTPRRASRCRCCRHSKPNSRSLASMNSCPQNRGGSESTATQAHRSGPCPRLAPWRRSTRVASPSSSVARG